ncbi:MAG: hypothetical protein KC535_06005 [Nanoarchaeota archaeon]|nr:hypothetical protein [Nanoarchaeota archaeon]
MMEDFSKRVKLLIQGVITPPLAEFLGVREERLLNDNREYQRQIFSKLDDPKEMHDLIHKIIDNIHEKRSEVIRQLQFFFHLSESDGEKLYNSFLKTSSRGLFGSPKGAVFEYVEHMILTHQKDLFYPEVHKDIDDKIEELVKRRFRRLLRAS